MSARDAWEKRVVELARKRVGNCELVTVRRDVLCAPPPKRRVTLAASTPLYQLVGMCVAAGLPKPVPEWRFHPTRAWRFDYAFVAEKLAVEIEGGIWKKGGGAHSHPLNIKRDLAKYNEAAILGWRILRAVPERWTEAIVLIQRALDDGTVAA